MKALRQSLGLSQTAFSRQLGLTQPSLSNLESGVTQPSWETLQALHTNFGVSLDSLLFEDQPAQPTPAGVTSPTTGEPHRIPLLEQAVMAGYFAGTADPDFSLQPRYLVHPEFHNAIAVEVTGSSMEPTIKARDILICTPIAAIDEQFDDNYIYVVVTAEGALVKRVVNRSATDGTLVLKSDNREFDVQTLSLSDVVQVYRVRRRITANLAGPERVNERLWELEQQFGQLLSRYRQLEAKLFQRNT